MNWLTAAFEEKRLESQQPATTLPGSLRETRCILVVVPTKKSAVDTCFPSARSDGIGWWKGCMGTLIIAKGGEIITQLLYGRHDW
jgi:hypothetical protein